jgi:protein gp37
MGASSIEWTEQTWNPVVGCTKVSPGCAHCYAETMAKRIKAMALADLAAGRDPGRKRHYIDVIDDKGRWNGKLAEVPEALADPMRWKKSRRVFVNSMSDLFHESLSDDFITAVFGVMSACPQHTFQVLTKRAERMRQWTRSKAERGGIGRYIRSDEGRNSVRHYFDAVAKMETVNGRSERRLDDPWMQVMNGAACNFGSGPLLNVWLGVSVENQATADERIPQLLKTPAAVRFLSCEPLLGPIDFSKVPENQGRIDWVIVGGESGGGARPFDVEWVRSIVHQCKAASVACFVKQLGAVAVDRNDAGFEGDEPGAWPMDTNTVDLEQGWQGQSVRVVLRDKKGGDWNEWPNDLRVREFPTAITRANGATR